MDLLQYLQVNLLQLSDSISPAAKGASKAGDAATPSPLPKTLKPVLTTPVGFLSIVYISSVLLIYLL